VVGVLLVAIVDECQCKCILLNNDVDPIVRRAWSKLSMRWRYAEAQATVLLNDGFAVLDRERPDVDSKLGDNGSDWIDVSGDASANVTRFRLSRASPATAVIIWLVFVLRSVRHPPRRRRALQLPQRSLVRSRSFGLRIVLQLRNVAPAPCEPGAASLVFV
jgi:hypothetical protein